ncbi:MAG: hypothetical protein VX766_04700 [Pseudomonadota bacterium]|nr:hypothetical protein [Pseudomonadota bacterium]
MVARVCAVPVALFEGAGQLVVTRLSEVAGTALSIPWPLTAASAVGVVAMAQ